MEQVAQMMGVRLEEEFKLNDSDDYKYKITKDGMFMYSGFASDWYSANHILLGVLIGKYEIIKPILDDVEKEYLKAVIKPFRDTVKTIIKIDLNHEGVCEFIRIDHDEYYSRLLGTINLPNFKKGTMYKGMEAGKEYSLTDLGL